MSLIIQLAEHQTSMHEVVGLSPTHRSNFVSMLSLQEHVLFKIDVWDDSTNLAATHEWTDRMFVFLSGESGQSMSHVAQGIRANHPTRYMYILRQFVW